MSCDPDEVAVDSRCLCSDSRTLDRMIIVLLCTWANGGTPPSGHGFLRQDTEDGGGFIILDDGGKIIINT